METASVVYWLTWYIGGSIIGWVKPKILIGICCLSAAHVILMSENIAWNSQDVSEWSYTEICKGIGINCQNISTICIE
jgi:hypothetical protein